MNAFTRFKKEIALSRPPEDDLSRLSYGELWAGVPPPEFVGSCGGARCTNGTCPQCNTSADEQLAALKRCGDRYKREECCVLCEKSGSVQVTVRDGETIHGRRTVAISLVGSPRACQFCRAEMEAATGWRDPGRCTGFGEADCPHKAGREGRDALCYRCACARPCPGFGEADCPHKAGREGHAALCYRCACARPCPGFGEADCPYKAGRAGHDALCYRCACAKPCPGFGEADCPHKAGRAGRDALCYRCVPPEQQSVQVVVPPGVNPGQRMRVRVSSQEFEVLCPRGVLPGQSFQVVVSLPAAVPLRAPHAALGREQTFTRGQAAKLNQQQARAVAKYFRDTLRIHVPGPGQVVHYPRNGRATLTTVRSDLLSKWPAGMLSVTVLVSS